MNCSTVTGPVFELHNREGHVENHDRLLNIIKKLPKNIPIIQPLPACREDIERVHHPNYLKWLHGQCARHTVYDCILDSRSAGEYFEQKPFIRGFINHNTYINPHSYEVATYAAGSAIAAMERTLDGGSCFALVRPPGHHAASSWAMGFCLLNNVAIAATKALTLVDRVAIIDWDLHHGNGTQDIFYRNNRVLYCSVHQNDLSPHTGYPDETGTGIGNGFTVNAPLPPMSGIEEYSHVFTEIFLPVLARMNPDMVFISAGQDALWDDPLGNMRLLPSDIGYLTGLICDGMNLPLTLVLEGGYGPSQGEAVQNIFSALGGARDERVFKKPNKQTLNLVSALRKIHNLPEKRDRNDWG